MSLKQVEEKVKILQKVRESIDLQVQEAIDLGIDPRWCEPMKTWSRECSQEIDYLHGLPNVPEFGPQSFDQVHP